MKNNNKNRKLNYIRLKNNLRTGKANFYIVSKKPLTSVNEEYLESTINLLVKKAIQEAKKLYKIGFKKSAYSIGLVGDDLVNNLTTIKIALSN